MENLTGFLCLWKLSLLLSPMTRRVTPLVTSPPTTAHVAVMPIPAWGHVRPLCAFVARLVQIQPVYVTFFIAGDNVARVQTEISQYFLAPEQRVLLKMIRFVLMRFLTGDKFSYGCVLS
jgi:hypothetical protein